MTSPDTEKLRALIGKLRHVHVCDGDETALLIIHDVLRESRAAADEIDDLRAQADALAEAVEDIASQKTTKEAEDEGDYEYGYDAIIQVARRALTAHREGKG